MRTKLRTPRTELLTEGRRLFDEYLRKGSIQELDVAKALRVSKGAVNNWRNGHAPPEYVYRLAIEKLTNGFVPAVAWTTEPEKTFVEMIEPLRPSAACGSTSSKVAA